MQPHSEDIGLPPISARDHGSREIGRQAGGDLREDAVSRRCRGNPERPYHLRRHVHRRELRRERGDAIDRRRPIRRREPLRGMLAGLRRVEAEPELADVRVGRQPQDELPEVGRIRQERRCDRAMNDDAVAVDVPEDAIEGGRSPARVVLGRQPVDGDDNPQVRETTPSGRNRADGARDQLHLDPHPIEPADYLGQLARPQQGLAADERDVQRPMELYLSEHFVHQAAAARFRQNRRRPAGFEAGGAVGIAARAVERASPGHFDREERPASAQDPPPGREDGRCAHDVSRPPSSRRSISPDRARPDVACEAPRALLGTNVLRAILPESTAEGGCLPRRRRQGVVPFFSTSWAGNAAHFGAPAANSTPFIAHSPDRSRSRRRC